MTAKRRYVSGHCAVGRHEACAGKYGAPGPEATCSCPHHAAAGVRVDEAFAFAMATCRDVASASIDLTAWYSRVGANLEADLHAAYPSLWEVAIPGIEVPL